MSPVDIILTVVIIAVLVLAVIGIVKRKKNGSSCCGDCAKCKGKCSEE